MPCLGERFQEKEFRNNASERVESKKCRGVSVASSQFSFDGWRGEDRMLMLATKVCRRLAGDEGKIQRKRSNGSTCETPRFEETS